MEIPYEKTLADLFRWRVAESGEDVAHKFIDKETTYAELDSCLLYTSPSPRDRSLSRMPSSA